MARGWWKLSIEMWDSDDPDKVISPDDATLAHIAECIADGNVEGDIYQEDEED